MDENKYVIFKIKESELGISITDVVSIERQLNIVPIPESPAYLLGVINLRGTYVPVYSLRQKFGFGEQKDLESQLIVTKSNGVQIALKVDTVDEIEEVASNELYDLPEIVSNGMTSYVDKVAHIGKKLVLVMDLDNVLNKEEIANINKAMEEVEKGE